MVKESSIEKVVGKNFSERDKKFILEQMKEYFCDQDMEGLEGEERGKEEEEKQAIILANKETNKLLGKYGLPPFDVGIDKFHIMENDWRTDGEGVAYFNPMRQTSAIRGDVAEMELAFIKTVFHDMVHFKSYGALQQKMDSPDEFAIHEYRAGLRVDKRSGNKRFFGNLNEAVTEETAKRFLKRMMADPPILLEDAVEEFQKNLKKFFEENPDLSENEKAGILDDIYLAKKIKDERTGDKWLLRQFSYPEERQVLNTLIDKLYAKNEDKYGGREEVFDVFASSMFTGNILPLGRLIDKTFGKGTFRKIGELDENVEELKNFTEEL